MITKKGMADADLKPKDVDQEVFALFQIFDEDNSLYFEQNVAKYLFEGLEPTNPDDFGVSFDKPSINGFVAIL